MFENHRKSRIQHCERSELLLYLWSLGSNSVTRQVNLNRSKIGEKCQNSNATFWVIFKHSVQLNLQSLQTVKSTEGPIFKGVNFVVVEGAAKTLIRKQNTWGMKVDSYRRLTDLRSRKVSLRIHLILLEFISNNCSEVKPWKTWVGRLPILFMYNTLEVKN